MGNCSCQSGGGDAPWSWKNFYKKRKGEIIMLESKKMIKIYLYSKFERFWHWVQAALIIILIITGLEIHGSYKLFGFERAVTLHNFFGLSWLVLYAFIVFWLFTTGEWKQYIPTTRKLYDVAHYYCVDIFKGKPHPVQKCKDAKHNPLQSVDLPGTFRAFTSISNGHRFALLYL
jgi:Ni,Fe-hydrogenase I cytochrome b subunit